MHAHGVTNPHAQSHKPWMDCLLRASFSKQDRDFERYLALRKIDNIFEEKIQELLSEEHVLIEREDVLVEAHH